MQSFKSAVHDIQRYKYFDESLGIKGHASRFMSETGADEAHIILAPAAPGNLSDQLAALEKAYLKIQETMDITAGSAVFKRFFLSDIVNQWPQLTRWEGPLVNGAGYAPCAVSAIEQSPLPEGKIAVWAYHIMDNGTESTRRFVGPEFVVQRNGLKHCWTAGMVCTDDPSKVSSSHDQTDAIFHRYDGRIAALGMRLRDHLIRTWLFVQNIDTHYEGIVRARRYFFAAKGLTKETHFIASTGIEGKHQDPAVNVVMDAYAVEGIQSEQMAFLEAPAHLNPTHEYGVTFERGTRIDYSDRRHIFISGTASIDNTGAIVHEGNVHKQMLRALENVEAVLKSGGAGMEHIVQMIVYLRDLSDRGTVQHYLDTHLASMPYILTLAPVCRPGWLIEFECIAIVPVHNDCFAAF